MPRRQRRVPDHAEISNLLWAGDELTAVLKTHLALEAVLHDVVRRHTREKLGGRLDEIDNLRFPALLDVAIALGAIPPDFRAPWREINSLRNQLAHDLDARITTERARRLYKVLPEDMRFIVETEMDQAVDRRLRTDPKRVFTLSAALLWSHARSDDGDDTVRRDTSHDES